MLQSVVGGETACSSFLLEELGEILAGVLTATIGTKQLDLRTVLGLCPGCKSFVSLQSLIFSSEDVDTSKSCVVVGEGNIIASSAEARNGGWAPEVGVNLSAEMLGWRGHALTMNGFTSQLHILA